MDLFALCCSGATCPCSSYLYSKYFIVSIYQEHENIWITFTLLLLQYFSISCYDKVSLNVSWETIAMIIWHIAWKIHWGDCLTFHTHCCSLGLKCGVISKREVSKSRDFLQQKGVAWPDIGDFVLWGRNDTMMASMQLLDLSIYRFNSQASTSKVESVCRFARCSGIHL